MSQASPYRDASRTTLPGKLHGSELGIIGTTICVTSLHAVSKLVVRADRGYNSRVIVGVK